MVLTAKPAYLLALCGAQSISVPACITVGLRDPVADRLGGGFEFTSQLLRCPSGANQLNHLAPEGWRSLPPWKRGGLDFCIVDTSSPKGQGSTKAGQFQFEEFRRIGEEIEFANVASGPLVRSSYHADRQAAEVA